MTAAEKKRIEALEAQVDALKASVDALLAVAGIEVVEADPVRAQFEKFRERAEKQAGVLR